MKKEVSPELYNYNKFPGPSFVQVGEKIVSENIELHLVANHKDAFDQTVFGQRFSQLMLKFDYIVGDWGNEQLRLKGFYKDDKSVPNHLKISRLDDYLLEFCNFGCAYFVLENEQPQELPVEVEDRPRRRRSRSRSQRKPQANAAKEQKVAKAQKPHISRKSQKQERNQKQDKKDINREIQAAKRGFVIRQKQR